jgi:hypothetical protein
MPEGDAPKLIIDTDWKSQAQAEKDRLQEASKSKPAAAAPGQPGAEGEGADREVGMEDLVRMLVTQALSYMGAFPDPRTGKAVVSIEMARVFIDLLGVLEDKTKGNLTPEESTLISRTLSELRLEWVDLSKMIAKGIEDGSIKVGGPDGGPGAIQGGMPGGPGAGQMGGAPDLKLKF